MWSLIKKPLFGLDAEQAHTMTLHLLKLLSAVRAYQLIPKPQSTPLYKMGLTFSNPVGLAAGLDKNAECLPVWQSLGFGYIEVGTVTAIAQPGNPKPRLFRLQTDEALFNRMGFNNLGAQKIAARIAKARAKHRLTVPIGVNIGKSKTAPLESSCADYLTSFKLVEDIADYITINVSSPNTPNLRELQNRFHLEQLMHTLANHNAKRSHPLPLLLKLAPDLHNQAALDAANVALEYGLNGLIISNTTTDTHLVKHPLPKGTGGISGKPLFERSTQLLHYLRTQLPPSVCLVGVGGIHNPQAAKLKLQAGADLLQIYTGLIYNGPFFVRQIVEQLQQQSHLLSDELT